MEQYLRKVRATFNGGFVVNPGGISLEELKIEFEVNKSISSTANTATISLYNLSESHRNMMGKEFDEVMLEAGYMPPSGGSNVGIIFKGNIRDVVHSRPQHSHHGHHEHAGNNSAQSGAVKVSKRGADIVTTITCGDGDKAVRKAALSKSYQKGAKVKDVVNDLYGELAKQGVTQGEWKFPDNTPDYKRPYAICGSCARELNTIGRGRGFYWNIQNGAMEVIPGDGFIGDVTVISPVIDTPALTDNGCKVSTLLNPDIRPNRRIQVTSSIIEMNAQDGIYRVSECTYQGDNREGEFRVNITGEALQGGKIDEGQK
jgi:hypothetical protein